MQLSEEGLAYCGEKTTGELKQWNITEKNFEKKPHSKAEYDNASEEKKVTTDSKLNEGTDCI